jgi:hypothetical protein
MASFARHRDGIFAASGARDISKVGAVPAHAFSQPKGAALLAPLHDAALGEVVQSRAGHTKKALQVGG